MALTLGGYDRIIRHRGNGIEAVEIVWHPGTRTPKSRSKKLGFRSKELGWSIVGA